MTAMAYEPYPSDDVLLEGFLALQTPEGFKAELIDGEIIVSPPPGGYHERAISQVNRQVMRNSPLEMDFSGNRGLVLPSGGRCPKNHVIPDGVFAPAALDLFGNDMPYMPPDDVALVVEVTSTRPQSDREAKRCCYARARIPLYLLIDRDRHTVTLFGDPEADDYTTSHSGAFGKPIDLPAPFSFTLDTTDFV
ncbi:Uma2 family endonuclease [Actinomadura craniellae]|uniref:Uma2 family endonuclease n=1 Tax=Actinomadura craniellae TaxID=2231787 RepID=A0A365H6Y1_9ACTN|nr:Uma2 family endonuclease [Actinomadura craniellae]RAY14865.1 Uma2 family endonuclease [Actinomadura craniellae]